MSSLATNSMLSTFDSINMEGRIGVMVSGSSFQEFVANLDYAIYQQFDY